jgi:hypothetical protein
MSPATMLGTAGIAWHAVQFPILESVMILTGSITIGFASFFASAAGAAAATGAADGVVLQPCKISAPSKYNCDYRLNRIEVSQNPVY